MNLFWHWGVTFTRLAAPCVSLASPSISLLASIWESRSWCQPGISESRDQIIGDQACIITPHSARGCQGEVMPGAEEESPEGDKRSKAVDSTQELGPTQWHPPTHPPTMYQNHKIGKCHSWLQCLKLQFSGCAIWNLCWLAHHHLSSLNWNIHHSSADFTCQASTRSYITALAKWFHIFHRLWRGLTSPKYETIVHGQLYMDLSNLKL